MLRIALDMDEVIADVIPKFSDIFEAEFGRRPKLEEYRGGKIYDVNDAKHIRNALFEPGFFADLPVMEGSQEVVKWMNEHFDLYIVTAAAEFRNSLQDKYDWLGKNFPFIHWSKYVFCGNKSIINADYLIDDHVKNMLRFSGKGVLYTASHNINNTDYDRVNDWKEVREYFENVLANSKK